MSNRKPELQERFLKVGSKLGWFGNQEHPKSKRNSRVSEIPDVLKDGSPFSVSQHSIIKARTPNSVSTVDENSMEASFFQPVSTIKRRETQAWNKSMALQDFTNKTPASLPSGIKSRAKISKSSKAKSCKIKEVKYSSDDEYEPQVSKVKPKGKGRSKKPAGHPPARMSVIKDRGNGRKTGQNLHVDDDVRSTCSSGTSAISSVSNRGRPTRAAKVKANKKLHEAVKFSSDEDSSEQGHSDVSPTETSSNKSLRISNISNTSLSSASQYSIDSRNGKQLKKPKIKKVAKLHNAVQFSSEDEVSEHSVTDNIIPDTQQTETPIGETHIPDTQISEAQMTAMQISETHVPDSQRGETHISDSRLMDTQEIEVPDKQMLVVKSTVESSTVELAITKQNSPLPDTPACPSVVPDDQKTKQFKNKFFGTFICTPETDKERRNGEKNAGESSKFQIVVTDSENSDCDEVKLPSQSAAMPSVLETSPAIEVQLDNSGVVPDSAESSPVVQKKYISASNLGVASQSLFDESTNSSVNVKSKEAGFNTEDNDSQVKYHGERDENKDKGMNVKRKPKIKKLLTAINFSDSGDESSMKTSDCSQTSNVSTYTSFNQEVNQSINVNVNPDSVALLSERLQRILKTKPKEKLPKPKKQATAKVKNGTKPVQGKKKINEKLSQVLFTSSDEESFHSTQEQAPGRKSTDSEFGSTLAGENISTSTKLSISQVPARKSDRCTKLDLADVSAIMSAIEDKKKLLCPLSCKVKVNRMDSFKCLGAQYPMSEKNNYENSGHVVLESPLNKPVTSIVNGSQQSKMAPRGEEEGSGDESDATVDYSHHQDPEESDSWSDEPVETKNISLQISFSGDTSHRAQDVSQDIIVTELQELSLQISDSEYVNHVRNEKNCVEEVEAQEMSLQVPSSNQVSASHANQIHKSSTPKSQEARQAFPTPGYRVLSTADISSPIRQTVSVKALLGSPQSETTESQSQEFNDKLSRNVSNSIEGGLKESPAKCNVSLQASLPSQMSLSPDRGQTELSSPPEESPEKCNISLQASLPSQMSLSPDRSQTELSSPPGESPEKCNISIQASLPSQMYLSSDRSQTELSSPPGESPEKCNISIQASLPSQMSLSPDRNQTELSSLEQSPEKCNISLQASLPSQMSLSSDRSQTELSSPPGESPEKCNISIQASLPLQTSSPERSQTELSSPEESPEKCNISIQASLPSQMSLSPDRSQAELSSPEESPEKCNISIQASLPSQMSLSPDRSQAELSSPEESPEECNISIQASLPSQMSLSPDRSQAELSPSEESPEKCNTSIQASLPSQMSLSSDRSQTELITLPEESPEKCNISIQASLPSQMSLSPNRSQRYEGSPETCDISLQASSPALSQCDTDISCKHRLLRQDVFSPEISGSSPNVLSFPVINLDIKFTNLDGSPEIQSDVSFSPDKSRSCVEADNISVEASMVSAGSTVSDISVFSAGSELDIPDPHSAVHSKREGSNHGAEIKEDKSVVSTPEPNLPHAVNPVASSDQYSQWRDLTTDAEPQDVKERTASSSSSDEFCSCGESFSDDSNHQGESDTGTDVCGARPPRRGLSDDTDSDELPDLDVIRGAASGRHKPNKPGKDAYISEDDSSDGLEKFFQKMKHPIGTDKPGITKKKSSNNSIDEFIVDDDDISSEDDEIFYIKTNNLKLKTPKGRSVASRRCTSPSEDSDDSDDGLDFKTPMVKPKRVTSKTPAAKPPPVSDNFTTPLHPPPKLKGATTRPANIGSHLQNKNRCNSTGHEPHRYGFLASLSSVVGDERRRHPEAVKYVTHFKKNRDALSSHLFKLYNSTIFQGKLPENMPLTWNSRLYKTAGYCAYKKDPKMASGRAVRIELSVKVCDSAERVRDTLVHEMCHAMVWFTLGKNDGHGPYWKHWARQATLAHADLPPISRLHTYQISTKYTYKCTKCGYQFGRHSKSLDTDRKVCGYCKSPFELLVNTKKGLTAVAQTPKTPNRFAIFVKENYGSVKKSGQGLKHKDIMGQLSKDFATKNKI